MEKTILIILTFFLFSCQKEDAKEDCKTCELVVDYSSNTGGYQHYIAESREICDDSWQQLDNTLDGQSGSGIYGETHWTRTMIWHCK